MAFLLIYKQGFHYSWLFAPQFVAWVYTWVRVFWIVWLYNQLSGGLIWVIYPYSSVLLHWHRGIRKIMNLVSVKLPDWLGYNRSSYKRSKTQRSPNVLHKCLHTLFVGPPFISSSASDRADVVNFGILDCLELLEETLICSCILNNFPTLKQCTYSTWWMYVNNIKPADGLVTEGARVSAGLPLALFSRTPCVAIYDSLQSLVSDVGTLVQLKSQYISRHMLVLQYCCYCIFEDTANELWLCSVLCGMSFEYTATQTKFTRVFFNINQKSK